MNMIRYLQLHYQNLAVALIVLGLNLRSIQPAEAATFITTGSMFAGRQFDTATLLLNGTVLVAGGYDTNNTDLSSAEVYDPPKGLWTLTGSMATARQSPIGALLTNGMALVAGGYNAGFGLPNLSSTELYDPATGLWTTTGSLNVPRNGSSTLTLLSNGKLLITGGSGPGFNPNPELYDPATGLWTFTGSMNFARSVGTATLLTNGMVLVAGGYNDAHTFFATAELYDPTTGLWSLTGSMATAREGHTATLLPNGNVLVAGGFDAGALLASAELYDPSTGTWTPTGSMITARYLPTATLLQNGKLLVAGGSDGNFNGFASAELYDPATGIWTATVSMNDAGAWETATLLPDGDVLIAFPDSSAELYQPVSTPTITFVTAIPQQEISLLIQGDPGLNYRIDVSTNLTTWSAVTNLFSPTGSFGYIDVNASNFPGRFYRAVALP